MSLLSRIRLLRFFIAFVRDPQQTEKIFKAVKIVHKHQDSPVYKRMHEVVIAKPEFRERYAELYLPEWPTLAGLRTLPEGSFGRAVHEHMVKNNLDFSLFPHVKPTSALAYLNARIYQDHDLWHTLLGYTTELEDEMAIQAFNVAQYGSPFGSIIIAGGILHLIIKSPLRIPDAIRKVSEGYRRGERARFLPGMRLIDLLPEPLEEVREMAGITQASDRNRSEYDVKVLDQNQMN